MLRLCKSKDTIRLLVSFKHNLSDTCIIQNVVTIGFHIAEMIRRCESDPLSILSDLEKPSPFIVK